MAGERQEGGVGHSGGLDTSIILKWLQVTHCEVVTTADLGQARAGAGVREAL